TGHPSACPSPASAPPTAVNRWCCGIGRTRCGCSTPSPTTNPSRKTCSTDPKALQRCGPPPVWFSGGGPHRRGRDGLGGSEPLQLLVAAVEHVLAAGEPAAVGVLPERVLLPATRQLADEVVVAWHPQRVALGHIGPTGARVPPLGGGVDHRVASGDPVVGVGEVLDPTGHLLRVQPVALLAVRVVLDVQHPRQRAPVSGPAAPVGGEEL